MEELEVANGLVGIKCFELPDTYVLPTHWLLYSKGAGGVFTAVSLPRLMPSPLPPKSQGRLLACAMKLGYPEDQTLTCCGPDRNPSTQGNDNKPLIIVLS